ncbi:glucosamine-fructose-6-phosphate aminotransferase [Thermococcus onnurineus NA1]|uniref:Glutamine--fructose-6-phosphate aminotransferase [isomerizing] n=1 Tax=Thermococcus onnurineus (strain NA1) TaxID=523850 RepID=B6YVT9_THEON|nr:MULTISPECIES: glutamine--fructose-6-phosphate transaminase (isomerizing) [Thermococcus]ACJ16262.1 glucosamine-fructose-6-phosphate aminotransferase [Thermococcus onnurineus NA1]NJE47212.1 glutamine--fructose-6-phosphate transaminase (isomerizing) [Thermococcus sp. GR7]NJE79005.1 glutamine--fructose-6-phosphate transaminase (isomerizing) [Thermococcus sp. GR4]NJF22615.1 glutamine--fructose-6-phosphate transaminase (isomerizing) [Thermococcus sp. GR5]
MCGIIGYIGERSACQVIVKGLKRLEYRGYDSVGIVTEENGKLHIKKGAGRIDELAEKLGLLEMPGKRGIGHTRWATHGVPNDVNAHPQTDCSGKIALVHNGIIENYGEIKEELLAKGHRFESDTDTEVIAHLIEEELKSSESFEEAMRKALLKLKGSFALGIIYTEEPDRLYFVRNESPLVLGIGEGENFAASDVPAFLEYTNRAVFLDDGEYAVITKDSHVVKKLSTGEVIDKPVYEVEWTLEMAEKAGYPHFMLKEIYEQPRAIRDAIHGNAGVIEDVAKEIAKYDKIFFVAMGTSYHAALVGKYLLQRLAKKVPIVEEASEFRYEMEDLIDENTLVIAITQSGETADTLAAMKLAKARGAKVLAIVNVVGSMATRIADLTLYTHAGPEIGVAATKTYTTQLTVLTMLATALARVLGTASEEYLNELESKLKEVPELVEKVLKHDGALRELAEELKEKRDFFYIGRSIGVPTALEGALKLKEISYIHAEGLSAGELKHGPLALLENGVPVVAIAPSGKTFDKMVSNIEESKARGAYIIALGDNESLKRVSDVLIEMPPMDELLTPIVYVVPLQILAYHLAVLRGNDPDKPRNLAKSVTVE